jgi:hypothetical protein
LSEIIDALKTSYQESLSPLSISPLCFATETQQLLPEKKNLSIDVKSYIRHFPMSFMFTYSN